MKIIIMNTPPTECEMSGPRDATQQHIVEQEAKEHAEQRFRHVQQDHRTRQLLLHPATALNNGNRVLVWQMQY